MEAAVTNKERRTAILGASLALAVAVLGLLGYLPGLSVLGRVQENFIPMAPSTAICFLLQGSILLSLAFQPRKKLPVALVLMAITALTALFGLLEVPGQITGSDLNFEDSLVPPQGTIRGIPIARMSSVTGALFFLTGTALFLLLWRSYSAEDRPAHGAGITGSLAFIGGFVSTLGYLFGAPLLYGRGATVPIALTTAIAFLGLTVAVIARAGQKSLPLSLVAGPATSARLLRVFLPIVGVTMLVESIADQVIQTAFPLNPAIDIAATVVTVLIIFGVVISWVAIRIGRDIDDNQAALRSSEERFSKAFHYDPDAIAITSLDDMKLVDVNEGFARLTGFDRSEAIGKSTDELGLWPDQAERTTIVETIQTKRPIHDYEASLKIKSGEARTVVMSTEVIDMAGEPHVIAVVRDITERKKTEQALKQKDHDIRKAYVDILGAVTDEKLLILTDDEISASQGEQLGDPYTVSSFEDLAESRDFVRHRLKAAGMSDHRLKDMVLASGEAIVNGVKHGDTCEIQVYALGKTVQIRITDHGPGIDFSDLPRAALLPGFSTEESLGMGFSIIFNTCDRLLLSTGPEGTTLILESGDGGQKDNLDDILSRGLFKKQAS